MELLQAVEEQFVCLHEAGILLTVQQCPERLRELFLEVMKTLASGFDLVNHLGKYP